MRVPVDPTDKVAPNVCVFEVCNSLPGLLGWDYMLSRSQLHRHISVMEQTNMSC